MQRFLITRLAVLFVAATALASCAKKPTSSADADNGQNTRTFVNAPDGLTGALKNNYVDFSFQYPQSWVMDPASSQDGASNFVRIERRLTDKGGKFTLENFAVGYFHGTGTPDGDKEILPKIAKQLEERFAHGFSNYKLISSNTAKFGKYNSYEFRFQSVVKETSHGSVTLWGRTVLIPNPKRGETRGVTLVMMASSLAPEIESASDVGVKGELPQIIKSFKLGDDAKTDSK